MIIDDVLTQWYELVVLRRTRSGRLVLEGCRLFPPSAQPGDRQPFTIRCEPSDGNGTVFAVVTCDPPRNFRLVSIESVSLTPGCYDLTAELTQPGLIRFHGLPSEPRVDHRSWQDLIAAIPSRIDLYRPAHLVCVVEVSGIADQVQERLSRIEQLIRLMAAEERELSVSLISYGAHSFDRKVPEEPVQTLTWAAASDEVLSALGNLSDREVTDTGYARAAQLECALTKVAERLTGRHGRPVLVTVGSRPAFPHRMEPGLGDLALPGAEELAPGPAADRHAPGRHLWRHSRPRPE